MVVRNMDFNDPNLNRGDELRNEGRNLINLMQRTITILLTIFKIWLLDDVDEEMNEEEADGMQEGEEEDDVVISEQGRIL